MTSWPDSQNQKRQKQFLNVRTPARPCLEIQDKRGKWLHLTKILGSALVILMIAFSNPSNADAADHEQENDRELWINFGMYSLHGEVVTRGLQKIRHKSSVRKIPPDTDASLDTGE